MERKSIQKKASKVEALKEQMLEAKTIVLFDYKGLTVDKFTELRAQLREEGNAVNVHKNNISKRAAELAGFEGLSEQFVGPKALVLGYEDVVSPAKILADFSKENKTVEIEAGVIEGKVVLKEGIMELANLPSRETLLTQLAAGLLMPIKEVAIGLNMLAEEQEQSQE